MSQRKLMCFDRTTPFLGKEKTMRNLARRRQAITLLVASALLIWVAEPLQANNIPMIIPAYDGGALGWNGLSEGSATDAVVGPYWVSSDDNISGEPEVFDIEYRNYHKFDLSNVTQQIASAQLILEFPDGAYTSHYENEWFDLHEVTSDLDEFGFDFDAGVGRPYSDAVYEDLGDGTSFGYQVYTEDDEGTSPVIELNAAGVAAINAAIGGLFCIGGAHGGGGHGACMIVPCDPDVIFDNTGPEVNLNLSSLPFTRQLILTPVPEPSAFALLGAGVLGVLVSTWRRRRH
jgi:hypothetical protein